MMVWKAVGKMGGDSPPHSVQRFSPQVRKGILLSVHCTAPPPTYLVIGAAWHGPPKSTVCCWLNPCPPHGSRREAFVGDGLGQYLAKTKYAGTSLCREVTYGPCTLNGLRTAGGAWLYCLPGSTPVPAWGA